MRFRAAAGQEFCVKYNHFITANHKLGLTEWNTTSSLTEAQQTRRSHKAITNVKHGQLWEILFNTQ